MYRIREDFGKKTAEEIREGSVVKLQRTTLCISSLV